MSSSIFEGNPLLFLLNITLLIILGLIHIFSAVVVYFMLSDGAQVALKSRPIVT